MHIQKVLNSSVVLVQDDSGEESILLGKGIGYGRKAGEPIERQPSDRVFLPLSNPDAQPMLELFSSIPASYLELTQDIVDDAEQSLGVKLSAHIYLLLTDHLHFAVERQQKGLVVTNRIFWEIKHFYPKEYAVGQRGLQKVKAKLGIELPDEEAGNIAFHIVNARQDPQAGYDAMRAAQLIGELSNIVTYSMHCPVSTESIILIITKVEDPEELDTRFSKFAPFRGNDKTDTLQLDGADNIIDIFQKLYEAKMKSTQTKDGKSAQNTGAKENDDTQVPDVNLIRLYEFDTLDDVIAAAHGLNGYFTGTNTLYKDPADELYKLVLHQSSLSPEDFNRVCNILTEYGQGKAFSLSGEAYLTEHGELISDSALQQLIQL